MFCNLVAFYKPTRQVCGCYDTSDKCLDSQINSCQPCQGVTQYISQALIKMTAADVVAAGVARPSTGMICIQYTRPIHENYDQL